MRKSLVAATLATLMLVMSLAPGAVMAASDEDSMDMTANVASAAPEITDVVTSTTWDVDSWENIYIEVEDNNGLGTITEVRITVMDNSKVYGDANAIRDKYCFKWTSSGFEEVGPDSAGDSHIDVANCSNPTSGTKDNWIFKVKTSKIANPTVSWDIVAEAFNGTTWDNEEHPNEFDINQYILQTLDQSSVSWSSIAPGATDEQCGTFPATSTVISNDTYKMQLKSENATWISGGNSFDVNNTKFDSDSDVAGATTLSTTYQDLYTGLTYTAEAGDTKNIYLWLSVPGGQAEGAYHNKLWVYVTH